MRPGGRKAVMASCLAVLLAARVPAPEAWMAGTAAGLAGVLALATVGASWGPAARLRRTVLPAAVALALLPASPVAPLSFLPWMVNSVALLVFLHLAFPAATAPAPPVGREAARGVAMRWLLPLGLLGVAGALAWLLPHALPAPLAALQELRPIGAILVAGLALCLLLAAVALLLRGLAGRAADGDGAEVAA